MIKKLGFILAGLSVLVLTGCGTKYVDGTYTGSSNAGMHGEFAVEMTVEGGKITDIIATVNNETPGIGTDVVDRLLPEVIKKQSADIDAVSGASKTSAAVIDAVGKAIEQAAK